MSIAMTAAEPDIWFFHPPYPGRSSTIDRIIDVFPPSQQRQISVQLASVLQAVVSQQLIPSADGNSMVSAFD